MRSLIALGLCLMMTGCASSSTKGTGQGSGQLTETKPQATEAKPQAVCPVCEKKKEQMMKANQAIVKIKIETSNGDIYADLYADKAPKTVDNFVQLAKKGYYDGLIFHRVIPGFMIQTGDPTGTGRGGPGYTFADEFSPALKHDKVGVISMANAGPNTNGSQFFITDAPTPYLDGRHSVFGQVTQGADVVKQIANVSRDGSDRPLTPVVMKKVTVLEN